MSDRLWQQRAMAAMAVAEEAHALIEALMRERRVRRLVSLPSHGASLDEIEREALIAALDRTGWHQANAAKLLDVTPRVMTYKVKRYGLKQDDACADMPSRAGKPRGWYVAGTPNGRRKRVAGAKG